MILFIPVIFIAGLIGLILTIIGIVQISNRNPDIKRKGTRLLIAGIITIAVSILIFFSTFWMSFRR